MLKEGGTRQLFISYARGNKPDVEALIQDLDALGYQTWVDSSLRGDQTSWEEILRRIADSDVFVAIVSAHTLTSVACKRELEWALALNKPVLPVGVERLPQPLPRNLSMLQVVDYSKPGKEAAFALAGALRTLPAPPAPEQLPEPPPAPLSYLSDLGEQVGQPEPLTHAQQHQILTQLQPALRSADPEEREGGRYVLKMFSRRDDLYGDVDRTLAQLEPVAYLDVAARLEQAAQTAQRRKALVDEMTALYQAGQWDAVVAAAEELARLDPTNPCPGGVVSDSEAKIRDAELSERYGQAWQEAADLFSAHEQEQRGHRAAAALLKTAEQQRHLTAWLDRAEAAAGHGERDTAVTAQENVYAVDPARRDAGARLEQARSARSVKQRPSLVGEMTALHQAGRWNPYPRHVGSAGGAMTAANIGFGPILHERARSGAITGAAIGGALVAGLLAAVVGPVAIAVAIGVGLFGLVAWRPVLGSYLYMATLPLIAGMQRGALVPLLRPNEALLVLLIAGAITGGYIRALRGAPLQLRLRPWDVPIAAFVLLSTVWPITSMLLRGAPVGAADVTAIFPVCKLAGLLLLVRTTVRTPTQVLWCIRLIIGGAVVLTAVAIVQTLRIGSVVALLQTWWPSPPEDVNRGTGTLSNAVATGDYVLISLTLLVMSGLRGLVGRRTGVGAGLVLATGILAAAQFSTWLAALLVGALVFRRLPARMRISALRLAPIAGIAVVPFGAPALLLRLNELSGDSSPSSWHMRWDNVTHLYIPELVEKGRFLVGVSPNSVLVPPDMWRKTVDLESGYLEFLWIGGMPLLAGFVVLSRAVFRLTRRHSSRTDSVGACAAALAIAWWIIVCLSLFDPHFSMRGSSDLLFILLGIVTGLVPEKTRVAVMRQTSGRRRLDGSTLPPPKHLITISLLDDTCRKCRARIWTGYCGGERVRIAAGVRVNRFGEVIALMDGLATYEINTIGWRGHEPSYRSVFKLPGTWPEDRPVHPAHDCGHRWAAEWLEPRPTPDEAATYRIPDECPI